MAILKPAETCPKARCPKAKRRGEARCGRRELTKSAMSEGRARRRSPPFRVAAEGLDLEREVRRTGALRLRTSAANQAGKAGLVAAEGLEPTRGVTPGR